ncbi:MAG TPA: phage protein GemA/Gp16 family protein [Nitrospiria bacterium]|nr:phage protein GemA/Gp16 family protein [Nitrospiria bacterium]
MMASTRQPRPAASGRQIRIIWALSHRRGMAEPALREWVEAVSGQVSLRRLTRGQASRLIEGLQGTVPDAESFRAGLVIREDCLSAAQQRLIDRLAGELGWRTRQVMGLARRMYGRVASKSLTRSQASGLIEALKAMEQRRAA